MKIGRECEGRLKGLRTLFCSAKDIDVALDAAVDNNVQQIYISDHENTIDLASNSKLKEMADTGFHVTVECTKIEAPSMDGVDVMLVIPGDSIWHMKPTDQIKFSRDLNVLAIAKENMIVTVPEDFAGDVEI